MMQSKYEQPIVQGWKQWEGRASRGLASKVCVGDTVHFRLTGLRNTTSSRFLKFRVAKVRYFASCKSMLQTLGIVRLLPNFKGNLQEARQLYEGLVGGGAFVAWRIDLKSVHVDTCATTTARRPSKRKKVHWNKQIGVPEKGIEQPRLNKKIEALLERF